ncbi:hypothetical protein SERLA73DRAFT_187360 [Serpula lacrymans var. lacrymans S7.3]|uniref:Uncharacterized protein n=2 Tax=Serpula lacrymans var. lacrymans TaxID=341189 RepID=F8Q917_SERL3|nr:uncharacterized protein SERLADRAFT_476858 [Serpula lacrymans var. lacrymans S7.9]EGN95072.1 hypothetical protein SERLA73DRAFT_187360 [Serpula lacrymans var. lacrymans S7.3]EGO20562.1 hypothetical protein SERLADRAFT_476858 [Serpula lacrymans var. lacrymans S7.9]
MLYISNFTNDRIGQKRAGDNNRNRDKSCKPEAVMERYDPGVRNSLAGGPWHSGLNVDALTLFPSQVSIILRHFYHTLLTSKAFQA